MISIDLRSRKSIYEQIVDGFKNDIVSGVLLPGDQLPSVRDLSAKLTVNPNTIQKAFKTLEMQGFIYPVQGRGNFVSEIVGQASESQKNAVYEKIEAAVDELRYLGVSAEEIKEKFESIICERRRSDDRG